MSVRFNRRKLLRGLGVSAAGVPLLNSIAGQLLDTAMGQAGDRRVALFFMIGETMPMMTEHGAVPAGIPAGDNLDAKYPAEDWSAEDHTGVTLPPMFEALQPRSDRMLIVDGLANEIGSGVQHGFGFGALSGVRTTGETPENGGQPAARTIDQVAIEGIGQGAPIPGIHFGFVGSLENHPDQVATTFAAGENEPVPHIASPSLLAERLFGGNAQAAIDPAELAAQAEKDALYRTRLLDSMRHNITTLQGRLAGEERVRLDKYLEHIETFEAKQKGLQDRMQVAGCNEAPAADASSGIARLESMFQMAGLAVRCGLTNVVGVSVGHGYGHDDLKCFNDYFVDGYEGHGTREGYHRKVGGFYREHGLRLVAEFLDTLGPMADNAVAVVMAGSGAALKGHHSKSHVPRFPALIYDGTRELKSGSRYLRYPKGERSIIDLYSSLSHVFKAPDDAFNEGSNSSQGPIAEIMA